LSEDLKDLFEAIGDVKRASVNFDKSGRSLGTATVVFSRRGDAIAAMKKYNGVPLDDSPMKIALIGTNVGAGNAQNAGNGNTFRAIHDEALTISVGAQRNRRIVAQGAGRVRRLTTGRNIGVGRFGGARGRGRGRGGARRSGFGRQVVTVTLR
jgi:THO complex subunit 4